MLQQTGQQVELPAGQLHRSTVDGDLPAVRVQGHRPCGELMGLALLSTAGGAEGGTDAGQQLFDSEGLGHVVVCAGVQSGHLIHHGVPCREQDDRSAPPFLPVAAQDFQAVETGEQDVQQNQVVFPREGTFQAGAAVQRLLHLVAFIGQLQLHHTRQLFLILYNQNTVCH